MNTECRTLLKSFTAYGFAFLLVILTSLYFLFYDNNSAYLRPIPEPDTQEALEKFGAKSCTDFLNKMDTYPLFIQAFSYDGALCRAQDLSKAALLYEESIRNYEFFVLPGIRLALIYRYGPAALQDKNRARFLFRQVAIYMASFSKSMDKKSRYTYIKAHLTGQPIPLPLQAELDWIDGIMAQDIKTRQSVSLKLSQQGFSATHFITHPITNP